MSRKGAAIAYEEEGSYLASVSDLMSGLIFVFIIALMVFAFSYKQYERDLTNTEVIRQELLSDLKQSLEQHGIAVQVDLEHGVLRLPEEVLFPLGSAELTEQGMHAINVLADELAVLLPCYTGPSEQTRPQECSEDRWHPGRLDTVLVEGHTDDLPLKPGGVYADNWYLSSARSIETYKALLGREPGGTLMEMRNRRGEPLFGVSGYAWFREVVPNNDDFSRSRNRRIDLRFLMMPPVVDTATGLPPQQVGVAHGSVHDG